MCFNKFFIFVLLLIIPIKDLYSYEYKSNSSINLPIKINLDYIANKINEKLPSRIKNISLKNHLCFEGEKARYNYPCFRNFQVYQCEGWTWSLPKIRCDISGYVDRNGPLTVTGSGNTFKITIPLYAKITGKALVQETAHISVTILVDATPSLSSNWEPTIKVSSNFKFNKPPYLELFDIIKVTLEDDVESILNKELRKIEREIPQILSGLKIRSNAEKVWKNIQKPVKLTKSPSLLMRFTPIEAVFSDVIIQDNYINTSVGISGETVVYSASNLPDSAISRLPDLIKRESKVNSFNINLPIIVTESDINELIKNNFETILNEKESIKFQSIKVKITNKYGFLVESEVFYDNRSSFIKFFDVFDWFLIKGKVYFTAKPIINPEKEIITIEGLNFDTSTNNALVDVMVDIVNLPILKKHFERELTYSYKDRLAKLVQDTNLSLYKNIDGSTKISGNIKSVGLSNLELFNKALHVVIKASGKINIVID